MPDEPLNFEKIRIAVLDTVGVPGRTGGFETLAENLVRYLHDGQLNVQKTGREFAWLDTGSHASLLHAGNFVRTLTERQGQQVESPEEVAFELGWINAAQLYSRAQKFGKNDYGDYLAQLSRTAR